MAKLSASTNDNRFISAAGIAAICVVVALLLLFALPRNNPQIERLRMAAYDIVTPIIDLLSAPFIALRNVGDSVNELGELRIANDALTAENEVLRIRVAELTQARVLMQQYRELLNIPAEPQFEMIPVRVVADLSSPFVKTVIANGGSNIGIEAGLAVMGTNGLVGRVTSVGSNSSRILLVTDFNSNIPVVGLASDVQAILSGRNDDVPFLQYVPPKASFKTGDLLVTSGRGGQVPVGLPVGTVAKAEENGAIGVNTLDDVGNLVYVRVVKMTPVESPPEAEGPILGQSGN